MRLAVFTNQFPGPINTFFARDMRALIECGVELDIFAIYPLESAYWSAVPRIFPPDILARVPVHHLSRAEVLRARPSSSRALWRSAAMVGASARYGPVPAAKAAYAAGYAWRQAERLHGKAYDHVLAYWGNYAASAAAFFHAATRPEIPYSMFVHARMDLYRHPAWLEQKLLYADNIFVVCEYNRRYLAQRYPAAYPRIADRIHVHHLGMPLDEVAFAPAERADNQLVAVGYLEPLKGSARLLDAMALLRSRGIDARLDIIGEGPEEGSLRSRIAMLGLEQQVTLRGRLPADEVLAAMRRATLLVHPSIRPDAMPTVIKEAMAVGTPVVASDLAGIPEMLDGGRCGILVPPGDVPALAAGIATMLGDPAARHGFATRARAHMEGTFDLWRNGRVLADRLRSSTRHAGTRMALA